MMSKTKNNIDNKIVSSMYITRGWSSSAGKNNANLIIYIRVRSFGHVWRRLHTTALKATATSNDTRPYEIPLKLKSQQDIEYLVESDINDSSVAAGFHAILIREDYANSGSLIDIN